jgi:ornithine cyclodeaminase/alanine dehydrogenase-like protein (mu-crystallin family)
VTLGAPTSKNEALRPVLADFTPRGALTILSPIGEPTGFLNAEEITAFRTALSSSLLISRRSTLKTITVFGAGRQAFWHIRLTLLLCGKGLKTVNIINRSFGERARLLLRSFYHVDAATKKHEGWANVKIGLMTPEYGEYDRLIHEQIRNADVIITTVPSTSPLFDPAILTSTEGRRKGRLIIAIGSYKPFMIELPTEIITQAVRPIGEHRHFHRHALEGGVVIVDSLTACMREAGEIIQAQLTPKQLVEVGELVMLEGQRASPQICEDDESAELDIEAIRLDLASSTNEGSSMRSVFGLDSESTSSPKDSRSSSPKNERRLGSFSRRVRESLQGNEKRSVSVDSRKEVTKEETEEPMARWLREGNVIYKSVGLGLMDLVVGGEMVKLARERGIGTTIEDF